VDDVFRALADPSRRQLLDRLNVRNGQTLRELCDGLSMARQSVSKHLAILESAGLVTTMWRGREKLHFLNAAHVNAIADRWIGQFARRRVQALDDLKRALETSAVGADDFVYTTYINTTPQRLWQALTDPAFTDQYWGVVFETDWAPGSTLVWKFKGITMDDPEQVVLESDPYRRLAYTWHTITPEFAASIDLSDDLYAKISAEPRSRVSFDIEPVGGVVKLTVVHSGFESDSTLRGLIEDGWASLLSGLKTFLETGERLPV
jgi:uncharacterized protein YndB with AHSA1/START domain/DNA-binding transcriptional ArsR family regulator